MMNWEPGDWELLIDPENRLGSEEARMVSHLLFSVSNEMGLHCSLSYAEIWCSLSGTQYSCDCIRVGGVSDGPQRLLTAGIHALV
jgi:hypothetical protein